MCRICFFNFFFFDKFFWDNEVQFSTKSSEITQMLVKIPRKEWSGFFLCFMSWTNVTYIHCNTFTLRAEQVNLQPPRRRDRGPLSFWQNQFHEIRLNIAACEDRRLVTLYVRQTHYNNRFALKRRDSYYNVTVAVHNKPSSKGSCVGGIV